MEAVGDAALGGEAYHVVHHVAAAGHDEAHAPVLAKHLCGGLDEIFGTFLHGDAAEERHHPLASGPARQFEQLLRQRYDGVVDRRNLGRVDAVLLDDGAARQVGDGDDVVGMRHAVLLDAEHCRVDVAARAVEVGGVDVYDEGLAGDVLGVYAGRVCQPVVRVYDVAGHRTRYHAGDYRVVVDLLEYVVGVTPGELQAAQVVELHVAEVGVYMVAQVEVELRVHVLAQPGAYVVPAYVLPRYGGVARAYYVGKPFLLVAPGLGYDEGDAYAAVGVHALGQAVAGSAEASEDMGRKFPPEH